MNEFLAIRNRAAEALMTLTSLSPGELDTAFTEGQDVRNWMKAMFQECDFLSSNGVKDKWRVEFATRALDAISKATTEDEAEFRFRQLGDDIQGAYYWYASTKNRRQMVELFRDQLPKTHTVQEAIHHAYIKERLELFDLILLHIKEAIEKETLSWR